MWIIAPTYPPQELDGIPVELSNHFCQPGFSCGSCAHPAQLSVAVIAHQWVFGFAAAAAAAAPCNPRHGTLVGAADSLGPATRSKFDVGFGGWMLLCVLFLFFSGYLDNIDHIIDLYIDV